MTGGARTNLEADPRLVGPPAGRGRGVVGREPAGSAPPAAHWTRTLLDSALYRVFLHPSTISDADGRYPGFDGTSTDCGAAPDSAISGWDYYRTHAPLLAWIRPDVAAQVVRSLLRDARQGGRVPKWPLVASETHIMNGDSAAPGRVDVRLRCPRLRPRRGGDPPGPAGRRAGLTENGGSSLGPGSVTTSPGATCANP